VAEWRRTTLGDLCVLRGGSAFPRHEQGLVAGEIPFIKVSDLNLAGNGYQITEANNFVSDATASRMALAAAESGSTVFAKIGAAIMAERYRVLTRRTAFDNNMMAATAIKGVSDPRFLYYLLATLELSRSAVGSALPYLTQGALAALPCCVPDLASQRAIAEVLGALDDKIAANTRLATTADALAAATLRASLSSHVAPLTTLAAITMGSSPPGTSYNENGTGVPFFQGVRDFGLRSPKSRVWTTSPVRLAHRGDTLLSVRAPVGQVNVAPTDLCIGRGLASVRSTLGRPWSLFHLLRDDPDVWAPYEAEGTVFGSINRDQLTGLVVPLVEFDEEARVERVLATLEARLGAALNENVTLAAARDVLLPALMPGKLRVRDAGRIVEGAA